MAQYSWVADNELDTSAWSPQGGAVASLIQNNGRHCVRVGTGDGNVLFSPAGQSASFDVVALVSYINGAGNRYPGVGVHLSPPAVHAEYGHRFYVLRTQNAPPLDAGLRRLSPHGHSVTETLSGGLPFAATTPFWVRLTFGFVDTPDIDENAIAAITVKVWQGLITDQPADWQIVTYHQTNNFTSNYFGDGYCGLYTHNNRTVDAYEIYVGTDGDPAPTGPVDPGTSRRNLPLLLTPW